MSDGTQPTFEQTQWLESVLGPQVWGELEHRPDFQEALMVSLDRAREIALKHMARREQQTSNITGSHHSLLPAANPA